MFLRGRGLLHIRRVLYRSRAGSLEIDSLVGIRMLVVFRIVLGFVCSTIVGRMSSMGVGVFRVLGGLLVLCRA